VSVDGTADGSDAVRDAIAASVERLTKHEGAIRKRSRDIEAVHQAELPPAGCALTQDFRPLVDPVWDVKTRGELGWLADLLGAVRDVDILQLRLQQDLEGWASTARPRGRCSDG